MVKLIFGISLRFFGFSRKYIFTYVLLCYGLPVRLLLTNTLRLMTLTVRFKNHNI